MSSGLSQSNPRGHTGYTSPVELSRAHLLTQRVNSFAQSCLCCQVSSLPVKGNLTRPGYQQRSLASAIAQTMPRYSLAECCLAWVKPMPRSMQTATLSGPAWPSAPAHQILVQRWPFSPRSVAEFGWSHLRNLKGSEAQPVLSLEVFFWRCLCARTHIYIKICCLCVLGLVNNYPPTIKQKLYVDPI